LIPIFPHCIIIKYNTTQHNTTQHNTTQHNTTQHNTMDALSYTTSVAGGDDGLTRQRSTAPPVADGEDDVDDGLTRQRSTAPPVADGEDDVQDVDDGLTRQSSTAPPVSTTVSVFDNYGQPLENLQGIYDKLTSEKWAPKIPGLYQIWNDDPRKPGKNTAMPSVTGPPSWFMPDGKVAGSIGCGFEYFSGTFKDMNSATVHTIWSFRDEFSESWLDMVADPKKHLHILEEFFEAICRTMAYHLKYAHPGAFGIPNGRYNVDEIKARIHFCACHSQSSLRRFHLHVASSDKVEQCFITKEGAANKDRHIKLQDLMAFLANQV
jgi:hypothetical protein